MTAARRDDEQATRDAPVGEMECWSEGEPIKKNIILQSGPTATCDQHVTADVTHLN